MDGDHNLMRRMKNGDEEAIDEFVQNYYPDILKYCFHKLNGSGEAEDMTQETFRKFFENFGSYRHYGKAKNYLYVIAGNLCKNYYQKKREILQADVPEQAAGHTDEIEQNMTLMNALRELPPDSREVLILHYFHDLKLREIAAILGIGLPLTKYRIAQGKKQLREKLGEEDYVWMY